VPDLRPDFTLHDVDGKAHPISEWDGHPLLVNFWASWCAPCRREIPLLNRLQAEPALKDLQIVGIAVDFPADVQQFLKKTPIHYPVLIGEQDGLDTATAFGVQAIAFPFSVFIDRNGHILSLHVGELHEEQARVILGVLDRVDSGELTPAAGRAALKTALAALPKPPPSPDT
jgi:thiol-disulfide isomerase/thioredoxin